MTERHFKFIAGLGNPDVHYDQTYHNIGSYFLNQIINNIALKQKINLSSYKTSYNFFTYYKIENKIYIYPATYMNESGIAILEAVKHFKIDISNLLIIHDDIDIPIGKYKLSFGRGSAGHNGVKSIIQCLKTKNFWRLRIGIKNNSSVKAKDLVLNKISSKDLSKLSELFLKIHRSYLE